MKIKEWRRLLDIMSRNSPHGEDGDFICCAEHDIVCLAATNEEIPPDSADGKLMEDLGCTPNIENFGTWGKFV